MCIFYIMYMFYHVQIQVGVFIQYNIQKRFYTVYVLFRKVKNVELY